MSDALTDILSSIHLKGSVFSRAQLSAPFGVESGVMSSGIFHAVVRGHPWIQLADHGDPLELDPGDVVMFPFGDNHLITDAPGAEHHPIGLLTSVDDHGMGHLVVDGGGPSTSLICGTLEFDPTGSHPLVDSLPPMIRVRDLDGTIAGVVQTLVNLIADEVDGHAPGSEIVVARLSDALLVFVLRGYIDQLEPGTRGWLGALSDPALSDAIGLIHRQPDVSWTAEDLAHAAGMSRSAFYARFKESVGLTPAEYLTQWRVFLGASLLRDGDMSVAAAGRTVGYSTEAAFSNAFLRVMGVRPGAYRRAA